MIEEKEMIQYCYDNPDKTIDEIIHQFEIPGFTAKKYIKEARLKLKEEREL